MHLPPLQVEATPQSQYSTDMPARGTSRTFPLPLSSSFPSLRFPSPLRQNKARVVHTVVQSSSTEVPIDRSSQFRSTPIGPGSSPRKGRKIGRAGADGQTIVGPLQCACMQFLLILLHGIIHLYMQVRREECVRLHRVR